MWKKRIWKACICLASIYLIVIALKIVSGGVFLLVYENLLEKAALPENGVYYCEELDATIKYSRFHGYYYRNGYADHILTPPGGTSAWFITESREIRASYRWNQKRDILKILFSQYPEEINMKKTYVFINQQDG